MLNQSLHTFTLITRTRDVGGADLSDDNKFSYIRLNFD